MSGGLPKGWAIASLADVAARITDGTHQPPKFVDSGIPFVVIGNIRNNNIDWKNIKKWVTPETFLQESQRINPIPGDILYSTVGSYGIVVEIKEIRQFMFQRHIAYIRPETQIINSSYLARVLESPICKEQADTVARGVAQRTVTLGDLGMFEIPIAPLSEQHRIVAKIDALFARSSSAREALAAIPALIDRYRQTVLAAAFRGDLTADWRAVNNTAHSVERYREKLAQLREEFWCAAEERRLASKGKPVNKSHVKRRYPTQATPNQAADWEVPEDWTRVSLDELSWQSAYGTSVKCSYDADGIAVARIPNVARGCLDLTDMKFALSNLDLAEGDEITPGDLIIVRTNGSKDLVGRGAVVAADPMTPTFFASYLIRFRLVGDETLWKWMSLLWHSPIVRHQVLSRAATSAGQYNISMSELAVFALPLAPPDEMALIVHRAETALSAIDIVEREYQRAVGLLPRLDQSILDKAFSGRLVPQDPADEPAAHLLERIRAARAAAPNPKRERRARG